VTAWARGSEIDPNAALTPDADVPAAWLTEVSPERSVVPPWTPAALEVLAWLTDAVPARPETPAAETPVVRGSEIVELVDLRPSALTP
jgi:hypothetical protein